jgi:aspartyl-tRNA synthetase
MSQHEIERTALRDCMVGGLTAADVGTTLMLAGWVHRRRDLGGLYFVDLRDRSGLLQVSVGPDWTDTAGLEVARGLGAEDVVRVEGRVELRPDPNPNMPTGQVELRAVRLERLSAARTPAIPVYRAPEEELPSEELRLRHRVLDLRRPELQRSLTLRHRLLLAVRNYMDGLGFVEVETPILTKPTPEGARDYLVPSRVHNGEFYALPQSPQIYKQILMVAGFDRYFQIARCFRDEDLRADRQPEFTQLDIEMSFVDQEDVLSLIESLFIELVPAVSDKVITTAPFPRMTFDEAVDQYGNDKPDMRFGLLLTNVTDLAAKSGFRVFEAAVEAGGLVKGVRGPGMASYTRREIDDLTSFVRARGAKGLVTLALTPEGIKSPLTKSMDPQLLDELVKRLEGQEGDLLLFVADRPDVIAVALGDLRLEIGRRLNLFDRTKMAFVWIVDPPLLEWNADEGHWDAKHHQFTAPLDADEALLDTNPGAVRAKQYDIVCNGYEVGGGSIRIHRRDLQERVFRLMGMTDQEANEMFGHLLEAFEYGTPPHGGVAPGIDRLVMLLAGEDNIREVIPFPKTQSATEPMTGSPSPVTESRLRELHVSVASEAASQPSSTE